MSPGMRPVRIQPADVAEEDAIKSWLDALASGSCDAPTFLRRDGRQVRRRGRRKLGNPVAAGSVLSPRPNRDRSISIPSKLRWLNRRWDSVRVHPRWIAQACAQLHTRRLRHPWLRPRLRITRQCVLPRGHRLRTRRPRITPRPALSHRHRLRLYRPPIIRPCAPTPAARDTAAMRDVPAAREETQSSDSVDDLKPGAVLRGRYRIEGVLGHGRMGTVFQVLDEFRLEGHRHSAHWRLKVLHPAVAKRADLLADLRREFQALQLLSHPNIIRVFEFDRDGPLVFFTMELLNGATAQSLIAGEKTRSLGPPASIGRHPRHRRRLSLCTCARHRTWRLESAKYFHHWTGRSARHGLWGFAQGTPHLSSA